MSQTQTNDSGQYQFEVSDAIFRTQIKKTGDFCNAITAEDTQAILNYIVGKQDLNEHQLAACDVTGDGTCSPRDASLIKQKAEGKINGFDIGDRCGSDWIFFPDVVTSEKTIAIQPDVVDGNCETGGIAYNDPEVRVESQDFKAVLVGDVNGNWSDCVEEPQPTATAVSSVTGGCQVTLPRYEERNVSAVIMLGMFLAFLFFIHKMRS